jgi:hypothetical protein
MPNVCRLIAPERILGNIGGMIPDSLEGATHIRTGTCSDYMLNLEKLAFLDNGSVNCFEIGTLTSK